MNRGQRRALAALLAGLAAFYFWTARGGRPADFAGAKDDYDNRLVHSFLAGHLWLDIPVAPALQRLADPYDPAQNRGLGVHDLSYYRGHYYLYFGVTPVVLLFLPYHVLTGGADFPSSLAPALFCSVGLLAAAGMLVDLRRRDFPRAGFGLLLAGVLAAGLGSFTLATMRRPDVWEVPIAAGHACVMGCWWSLLRARHAEWPELWLVLAGLAFGLAVGARPDYAPAGVALAIPLAAWWRQGRREGRWRAWPGAGWWRRCAALLGPVAACALALAWYNERRFGDPLEFGLRYQLTGIFQLKARLFSAAFVPFNSYAYFLAPAHWSRYFPFVKFASLPPAPAGYYGTEFVYGLLPSLPATWFAAAALLPGARAAGSRPAGYGMFVSTVAAFTALTTGVLLGFNTAATRYMADFVPGFVLLGATGALGCGHALAGKPAGRARLGRGLLAAALGFTAFFGLMTSFQLHDLLRVRQPGTYAALERIFNQPAYWAERLAGTRHGPLRIQVRLPQGRTGQTEPLVVTGWSYEADFCFLRYVDEHHLQFGLDHVNHGMVLGPVVAADYTADHTLVVDLGSLYPPASHPMFAGLWPAQIDASRRHCRITLDGRVVLEAAQAFYDSSPGNVAVGVNPISGAYGRRFSGRILEITRLPARAATPAADLIRHQGPFRFWVRFPAGGGPAPVADPLVATGHPGKGNVLYVEYLDDNRLRFGYDLWGIRAFQSDPIDVRRSEAHLLEVDFGALHRSVDVRGALREAPLVVNLDGREVWRRLIPFYVSRPDSIIVGSNPIGSTVCRPEFSGWLLIPPLAEQTPAPPPVTPRDGG